MRRITPSFITGSRAYGKPGFFSDVDIVTMMPKEEVDLLCTVRGVKRIIGTLGSALIKYKKIHLIACWDEDEYNVWKDGTARLKRIKQDLKRPITRNEARSCFALFRKILGMPDDSYHR